jgi:adenylate kinase
VAFLGPPGSGKGTQGARLASLWGVPHVSTGDLLRQILLDEPHSELARAVRVIADGRMVSDETAGEIVARELERPEAARGFVLDGYPRNVRQACALQAFLGEQPPGAPPPHSLDGVIALVVREEALLHRLAGRLTCPNCGASFHLQDDPPAAEGVCDRCGHRLVTREDDRPERLRTRWQLYHERTEPLIGFYRERGLLREVDGEGAEDEVFDRVRRAAAKRGTDWR